MGTQGAALAPRTFNAMVMRIVTKFTTEDEFIHSFARFCTDTTCFIPSAQAKRAGIETGFSIRLADGTPMLRGLCVVLESWCGNDNQFGRPGVQLGIRKLTVESKQVFGRLRTAGAQIARVALPPELDENGKPTIEMPALFPEASFEDAVEDSGGIPEPIDPVPSVPVAEPTVPSRAPVMTLLGVAPIVPPRPRPSAPRVSMLALSNEVRTTPAPRRSLWARLIGRVRAMFRTLRWAYRRRRGVRQSVRRLPTRT